MKSKAILIAVAVLPLLLVAITVQAETANVDPAARDVTWSDGVASLCILGIIVICTYLYGLIGTHWPSTGRRRLCRTCSGRGTVLRGPEAGRGPMCPHCLGRGYEMV
jgi:hypothetical protein